jgi:hypothetical protein
MMRCLEILAVSLLLAMPAIGQPTSAASDAPTENPWSFSLSAQTYFVPDEQDYVQPTITADHDWLHLEARYNYEDLNTVSTWIGYNFSGGEKLEWEFTPMVGGIFGDTTGVAPGYRASLSWWKLSLYSEGEYVFDTGDPSHDFFYSWSEVTISLVDWLRVGLAEQRTRADNADTEIQPGVVVGVSYKQLDLAVYVFEPYDSKPTVVVALSYSF